MTVNDDVTQEAPVDAPPPTEIDPFTAAADGPLAYSEHTSSMPVVEYQPHRRLPVWIAVLVLVAAASAVAIATFVLGRTTAPQPMPASPDVPAQISPSTKPSQAPALSSSRIAPPPVAAVPVPEPAPTTVTVTTRAIPQIACDSLRRYDTMTMNDVAMIMVEDMALGIGFNEAKVRVVNEVSASCPEFLGR
ncbi:hypothetical protein K3U94_03295 [Mycolicibacter heraklionensis]|uniref:DUF732 domain-containing protein n=1 Tax=Mycolicibacter heraklionensis TaxID=512402 RepID=A0A9X7ZGX0_9MYCO|nr:hypothetical protein [Mycolicibacter heraklionensis]QZA08360.1 hypothetical protein K3U94_03295 [Mycolicibacter heraklionensis]